MSVSCNTIRDLLPLYHDDVCSKDTKTLIEEHLKTCKECQVCLDDIDTEVFKNGFDTNKEQEKVKLLKVFKRKLLKKNIMVSVISILCAFLVLSGVFGLVFRYQTPISYEEGLLNVSKSYDGPIDIIFNGNDYHRAHAMRRTVIKDGVEKDIVFIYYTDTIWTRHFSRSNEALQLTMGNSIIVDYRRGTQLGEISERDISAVYYLIADFNKLSGMSDEEFLAASQDAVLLWEN